MRETAEIKRVELPFTPYGVKTWIIIMGDGLFGKYNTKKEAIADAKKYNFKIIK